MILRRIALIASVFLLCCLSYASQQMDSSRAQQILQKADGKSVCIVYSFSCTGSNGRTARGNGSLLYQKGMYKLENSPFSIYDDGKVKMTLNKSAKEAVRQKSSFQGAELTPASIIRMLGFNPKGAVISDFTGKDTGKGAGADGISVLLKDGTKISVVFKSVEYAPERPVSVFSFDTSDLGQNWTVTDLR